MTCINIEGFIWKRNRKQIVVLDIPDEYCN
jgi:hypothetical protein